MCKRCLKLELQESLFTMSMQIARLWASKATQDQHFSAVQKVRTAQQALDNAENQLHEHQRACHQAHTRVPA